MWEPGRSRVQRHRKQQTHSEKACAGGRHGVVLAAFNIDGKSPASACCQALHAGLDAIEGLTRANQDRELPLEAGVALHYGDVVYGNIGSAARLDFTVIGRAVNEANRIEALCRTLSRPLLISADFAKVCTCHPLVSLGHHRLRGVAQLQEIFTAAPK